LFEEKVWVKKRLYNVAQSAPLRYTDSPTPHPIKFLLRNMINKRSNFYIYKILNHPV